MCIQSFNAEINNEQEKKVNRNNIQSDITLVA